MLYRDVPIQSERGAPFDVALAFDFEGLDPTGVGAEIILDVRRKRGDPVVALELRASRREIAATLDADTIYTLALHATRAQMMALAPGKYLYGLAVVVPGFPATIMVNGTWTHLDLLVDIKDSA